MKNKRSLKISYFFLCIFLLSACAVGPDYVRPKVIVPVKFKEAKGKKIMGTKKNKEWKVAEPSDGIDRGEWWKIFHDAKLNALELQLNHCNQSIINAIANYAQALAIVDEARASYFPTLNGSLTITRQKSGSGSTSFVSSSNGTTTSGTATASSAGAGSSKAPSRITTTHSILLNASWEPDIWGLVRRTVEADTAAAQSSGALLAVTRLSSQASLAQYYFELRGLDRDQKLLNDTVIADKKILQLTRHQYASGVVALADVVQAKSQLETAEAAALNNGILRGQYEHAIAVLIGIPPGDFSLAARNREVRPPPIPLMVPSALLERRPDIAEAERTMAQMNAEIGVAAAAYYPSLTLNGSASAVGSGLAHWISLPMLGWSYGPALSQLIYDGGLRAATLAAARASYKASVAAYRQVVLAAFQDVEDNLVALRLLGAEAVVLDAAAADARLALNLMINQYKAGTVAYSSVLTSQIAAFAAEKNAADNNYLRMTAAVGLIKALGGGWQTC